MNALWQIYGRTLAIMTKEFFEFRRDKASLMMIFVIPLINLCVLGFSVNTDPKYVHTALIDYDSSSMSRTLVRGMMNTEYFHLLPVASEKEADKLFRQGKVQIVVIIPAQFARDLLAEKKPQLLMQTDATDPMATANATQALVSLMDNVFTNDLKNVANLTSYGKSLTNLILHKMYNPESVARLNVVPGLTGVILSIVLILMSSLSIIREREKGSLVHIINSPVSVYEFLVGKITLYFILGIMLAALILAIACQIMGIPIKGSLISLGVLFILFIILCLAVGVIFSTITRSQLQAMQLASFYFLLSTMLSGFMTPFFGMPIWSQSLGLLLPLTYFLRLSRGIMLKGYALTEMGPDFTSLLFLTVAITLLSCYLFRRSLLK